MSSTDFKIIKNASGDPNQKFVADMQRQLSRFLTKDLVDQLDDNEDIYFDGQDVEAAIKWQTDLKHNHTFRFVKPYYSPVDPGTMVTCWLRGMSMVELRDFSHYRNAGDIRVGEPVLVDGGPFDLGCYDESVGVKSLALRFNRPTSATVNIESISLPSNENLEIRNLTVGFSIFMRYRVFDLAQQAGQNRTLFQHIEDSIPLNGLMCQIDTSGRLIFIVTKGGATTAKQTGTGVVTTGNAAVIGMFLTFAVSGAVEHVYTWDDTQQNPTVTDQTLSNYVGEINWQDDRNNRDFWIFRRGKLSNGYVYGDFYDFKFYQKEKVVTSTEVGRHAINKLSISNIPFGQIIVSNHWATFNLQPACSFTENSFSIPSFEVCLVASFTTTSFTSASFNL